MQHIIFDGGHIIQSNNNVKEDIAVGSFNEEAIIVVSFTGFIDFLQM